MDTTTLLRTPDTIQRARLASKLMNRFNLDSKTQLLISRYFILRYSYAKFIDRFEGNLLTGVGIINVGDTTYSTIGQYTDTLHRNESNVEISFRAALPEYNIPAIAIIRASDREVVNESN